MAPRHKPNKSKIRVLSTPDLQPGDPVWVLLRHSPGEEQSIFSQRVDVEKFVAERQLDVTRWYVDEAKSGGTIEGRGAFEQMMLDSQQQPPPVRAIIVWDLSRFSRDDLEAQFYSADLRMRGYAILSMKDDIPQGEFSGIFEAFIRWKNSRFLRDLQAATVRGIDALVGDRVVIDGVERTGFAAGGRPPVGYEAHTVQIGTKPSGKPILRTYWEQTADEDLRSRVELAWKLAVEAARSGERPPVAEIRRRCSLFGSNCSYYDFLRTITYAGVRVVGNRRVDGAHGAYVSIEDFEMVQRTMPTGKLSPRLQHPRRVNSPFLLSGKVYCGYCGKLLNFDGWSRTSDCAILRCSGRQRESASCQFMRLPYHRFTESLLEAIKGRLAQPAALAAIGQELGRQRSGGREEILKERRRLEREIAAIDRAMGRLLDLTERGEGGSAVKERLVQREAERAEAVSRLQELPAIPPAKPVRICVEEVESMLDRLPEILLVLDTESSKESLSTVVARCELRNDGATAYLRSPGIARPKALPAAVGSTDHGRQHQDPEPVSNPGRYPASKRKGPYPTTVQVEPGHFNISRLGAALNRWLDGEIAAGRWEMVDRGRYLEVVDREGAHQHQLCREASR